MHLGETSTLAPDKELISRTALPLRPKMFPTKACHVVVWSKSFDGHNEREFFESNQSISQSVSQ